MAAIGDGENDRSGLGPDLRLRRGLRNDLADEFKNPLLSARFITAEMIKKAYRQFERKVDIAHARDGGLAQDGAEHRQIGPIGIGAPEKAVEPQRNRCRTCE